MEGYQKEYSIKAGHLNIYVQHLKLLQIDRRQTNKITQKRTKKNKGAKGTRTQAQLIVVSQTFDNILNITNEIV